MKPQLKNKSHSLKLDETKKPSVKLPSPYPREENSNENLENHFNRLNEFQTEISLNESKKLEYLNTEERKSIYYLIKILQKFKVI